MNFVKGKALPMLQLKKRSYRPRKWSSKDHYFYKQIIRNAQNISDIPSSLAHEIAEIVRNTSVRRSDWKKIARGLGIDDEGQLKGIEDVARDGQELPLYIALTSLYKVNPAASLGTLLESLMALKRYDILIKIEDSVQALVHEHSGWQSTKNSFSAQIEPEKHPVEEDLTTYDTAGCKKAIKSTTSSHTHCDEESNHDSAFYEQQSVPNSLLEILNMDETIKGGHDPVWKQLQNKEIFENRTPSLKKVDLLETTDFQFVNPTSKTQGFNRNITEKISEKESHSIDPNLHYSKVSKIGDDKTCIVTTMHTTYSAQTNTELTGSCNDIEKHYDSESTCDEDLDPDLTGQPKFPEETFSASLCDKYATLSVDSDTRRTEEDKHQFLSIANDGSRQSTQDLIYTDLSSDSDSESYDLNNTVNESIEDFVAERNASIRCVEKAEREPHSAFFLETCEPMKEPVDILLSSMSSIMPPDSSITPSSIKVIIVHSEEDSEIATDIATALVKEFQMVAVAECQLNPVWHLDPSMFRRIALYWADVIIPLITNKWLEDINNEKPIQKRETASLNTRSGFRILQNMFMNRGCINLSCIPVVIEGTKRSFQHYPEIRDAIKLSRDIYKNSSIKKLGDFIKGFHNLTKDARKEAKRLLLE